MVEHTIITQPEEQIGWFAFEVAARDAERFHEFQEGIASAQQLTLSGANLLANFQELEKRDRKTERNIANKIKEIVHGTNLFDLGVGVGSVETQGGFYKVPYAYKSWIDKGDKYVKEGAQETVDAGVLLPHPSNSESGSFGYYGFKTGKDLGYERELGDRWYFAFGNSTKFIVPVGQLEAVRLQPKDYGY